MAPELEDARFGDGFEDLGKDFGAVALEVLDGPLFLIEKIHPDEPRSVAQ